MRNKRFKTAISTAVAACLLSSSLVVAPPAQAVTPDNRQLIGGIWNAGNLIKEYFSWHGWTGWGIVGLTNVVITVGTGDTGGIFTRALFTALCGSTAAGVIGAWKPVAGPTTASHIKAIVKAGGVTAVASACSWATYFVTRAIDQNIPPAQDAINRARNTNNALYQEIAGDAASWNATALSLEASYKAMTTFLTEAQNTAKVYRDKGCNQRANQLDCLKIANSIKSLQASAENQNGLFNAYGQRMSQFTRELANDIRS